MASDIERSILDSAASGNIGDIFGSGPMAAVEGTYQQGSSSDRRLAADNFVSSMVPSNGAAEAESGYDLPDGGLSVEDYLPGLGGAAASAVSGLMSSAEKVFDDEEFQAG